MERNFTNENLEQFLKQSAESLRMRPREKVWKAISNHLNRGKRRTGFVIGFILLFASLGGYYFIDHQVKNLNHAPVSNPINQGEKPDVVQDNSTPSEIYNHKPSGPVAATNLINSTNHASYRKITNTNVLNTPLAGINAITT